MMPAETVVLYQRCKLPTRQTADGHNSQPGIMTEGRVTDPNGGSPERVLALQAAANVLT